MPEVVIAKPREGKFNKNAARRVRVAGKIPAVIYGAGDPVAIELDPKQISRILYSEIGHNTIFDVEIAGHPATKAMIVDWQLEPLNDRLIHADLKRIALDKVLRLKVRVKLVGIPNGVKNDGGVLDQVLREVEIECLPANIPSHLDVDVTALALNAVLRVSELPHPEGVTFLNPADAAVAHVTAIREEVVAPVEDVAAVEGAATEPEVAKKGKTDAAEGAEADKKAPGAKK
jgi:large subunit ribosomal protein L25